MASSHIFRIVFVNQGKVYEIYARKVSHGGLFGFVEVEELVFGERSSVVLDPAEERIKSEFAGVKRSYLPLQSVIRIDEVRKQGVSKITALRDHRLVHPATDVVRAARTVVAFRCRCARREFPRAGEGHADTGRRCAGIAPLPLAATTRR